MIHRLDTPTRHNGVDGRCLDEAVRLLTPEQDWDTLWKHHEHGCGG